MLNKVSFVGEKNFNIIKMHSTTIKIFATYFIDTGTIFKGRISCNISLQMLQEYPAR
jgi:hypothetical protein